MASASQQNELQIVFRGIRVSPSSNREGMSSSGKSVDLKTKIIAFGNEIKVPDKGVLPANFALNHKRIIQVPKDLSSTKKGFEILLSKPEKLKNVTYGKVFIPLPDDKIGYDARWHIILPPTVSSQRESAELVESSDLGEIFLELDYTDNSPITEKLLYSQVQLTRRLEAIADIIDQRLKDAHANRPITHTLQLRSSQPQNDSKSQELKSSLSQSTNNDETSSNPPSKGFYLNEQSTPTSNTYVNEGSKPQESSSDNQVDTDLANFNQRFQIIKDQIRSFRVKTSSFGEKLDANTNMYKLAVDFQNSVRQYGKIIISERYLPVNRKTIKPLDIGGIAGGEKFLVHSILFKFAVDSHGIYGNDASAAKVAGHELRSLAQVYSKLDSINLDTPLACILDYKGFRIIAMTILPIDPKQTLIYGSSDGGVTIKNSNPAFAQEIKKLAKIMNLKSHLAGTEETNLEEIPVCVDCEGHSGFDNRNYLVDLSRIFPPMLPDKNIRACYLTHLFRPEFVKSYHKPLCSDGFSNFIKNDPQKDIHNKELEEATKFLENEIVPNLANHLLAQFRSVIRNKQDKFSINITREAHRFGVNIRLIGKVLSCITDQTSSANELRTFILLEMVVRIVKQQLRSGFQNLMKSLKLPLEEPYKEFVAEYLNNLFAPSKTPISGFLSLIQTIESKFGVQYDVKKFSDLPTFMKQYGSEFDFRVALFIRLKKAMGLRLRKEFYEYLQKMDFFGITPEEISSVGEKLKHMNVINFSRGYIEKMKGDYSQGKSAKQLCYSRSIRYFTKSLESDPSNPVSWRNLSQLHVRLSKGINLFFEKNMEIAEQQLKNSIQADPFDEETLYQYSVLLLTLKIYKPMLYHLIVASEKIPYGKYIEHLFSSVVDLLGDSNYQPFLNVRTRISKIRDDPKFALVIDFPQQ